MAWLTPAVVAAGSASALLVFVYFLLWNEERRPFLLVWTLAWGVYVVRFAFELGEARLGASVLLGSGAQIAALLNALLLIWGLCLMRQRPTPWGWVIGAAVCVVLLILLLAWRETVELSRLPVYLFCGTAFIVMGVSLLRARDLDGMGRTLTGWAFILWGLHKFNYPMLREVPGVAPWGFLFGGILSITVAQGIVLIHLQNARRLLRERERNYREIYNAAEGGLMLHDAATGQMLDANRATERLFGYTTEELCRMTIGDLSCEEEGYTQQRALARVMSATTGPITFEWRARCKDGTSRTLEVHLTPTEIGGKNRVLAALRDVTESRVVEEQLRQAQKMEAVGQLAGGVAHDFNNLLQVIRGSVEIALETPGIPKQARSLLDEVTGATERGAALVRQLLTFSRRQPMSLEPLDPNEVAGGVAKMLARVIGEHIRIEFKPGALTGGVHADRGQLEQVLVNLGVNARDAMPEGGVLTIETCETVLGPERCEPYSWTAPGRFVEIRVSDTGCGMEPEIVGRIFDPFFTTKEVGKGTGLGLATVYGVVQQHRGFVTVDTAPGEGASFAVYLPLHEGAEPATGAEPSRGAVGGTETILVAEDEEVVRNLCRATLERVGYTVLTAYDGDEALRLADIHGENISLAVLDIAMPGLNGYAVQRRLKARFPRMHFLFVSGYGAATTPESDSEHAEFLAKPYGMRQLLDKVRTVLDA